MFIESSKRSERRLGVELVFGDVSVTEQVVAYQKRSIRTQETLDLCLLDLPPQSFTTRQSGSARRRRRSRGCATFSERFTRPSTP